MATRLETAGKIDRQSALDRGFPVERSVAAFPGRKKSEILGADDLEGSKGVMDFGKVDSLRSRVRHGVSACGCDLRRRERREHFAILKAQNSCALTDAREAHVAWFTRQHEGGRSIGNRRAVIEPQGRGDQLAAEVCLARDRALKLRRRVFRSVAVVFERNVR